MCHKHLQLKTVKKNNALPRKARQENQLNTVIDALNELDIHKSIFKIVTTPLRPAMMLAL